VRPIAIAAGGTGGHLFPAEALAAELAARGERIVLFTDARSAAYDSPAFSNAERFVLQGAGMAGRSLGAALKGAGLLARGTLAARGHLRRLDAAAVVGFGGYPSIPPSLAALTLGAQGRAGRPVLVLHEQNAVLGRANRLLATRADALALTYAETGKVPGSAKPHVVGNPVRPALAALAGQPYAGAGAGGIRLLVTGGSLGARVFADVVPAAVAALPDALRARLIVTQQCRAEDLERVRAAYAGTGIPVELSPFFSDMPRRLATAHLVVARAGASTLAELACAGRPALLVPLPSAIDDHQAANARALAAAGAALVLPQAEMTVARLTGALADWLLAPERLAGAAHAAASLARPQAARDLADLVLALAHRPSRTPADMRALPLSIGTIHFVGIGGIGMSGIAEVLHNLGYAVQGSDIAEGANVQRLRAAGIPVTVGHAAEKSGPGAGRRHLDGRAEGQSRGPGRARAPPAGRAPGGDAGELMRLKWGIAVGGTHGKTTTTSLIAAVLEQARLDPTVINGGIINAYGTNTRMGAGTGCGWRRMRATAPSSSCRPSSPSSPTWTRAPDHWGTGGDAMKEGYAQFVRQHPLLRLRRCSAQTTRRCRR
jgi:UDP-N-acetylglucosamine--N-acetylmuramyl-(pentapeptide) pyrophosphoryl-undecaprenol N-acetylglucosamine transferase